MKIKASLLMVVLIIAAVASLFWPSASQPKTLPKDTPISEQKSTEGSSQKADQSIAAKSPTQTADDEQANNMAAIAPKQLSVTRSVSDEKEYRTLASVNDPLAQNRWHLSSIQASSAWDQIDPEKQSVVAVIDSGFALAHEDLQNKWYQNAGETGMTQLGDFCWQNTPQNKATNGCDDDQNGYEDDWRGWDFYYIDNDPQAGSEDPNGQGVFHGTQVAGLVGAESNNGIGVASIGYTNKVMPLQVMSDGGVGFTSDLTAAVIYAVDNGADVINMSLGGADSDESLRSALQYAYDNDVMVIAAAGNCGVMVNDGVCNNLPVTSMTYPALYETVIAVGAITQDGARANFSSFGDAIDVVAPGSGTLSSTTWSPVNETSGYVTTMYGTSFSAPIVASIAGLVRATDPTLSLPLAKAVLVANSQKLSPMASHLFTSQLGHGLVDADQAVMLAGSVKVGAAEPELLMTGNTFAESAYNLTTAMGAGCVAPAGTWCGGWMHDDYSYDRYLPFQQIADDRVSWTWNTASLHGHSWTIRAISGELRSRAYDFMPKQ